MKLALWILTIWSTFNNNCGKRILLLPFSYSSHINEMASIAQELLRNGHDVYMVLSRSYPDLEKWKTGDIHVLTFEVTDPDFYSWPDLVAEEQIEQMARISPIEDYRTNWEGFLEMCTNCLGDTELFRQLMELQLDLAIVDAFPYSLCYFILPYKLDIAVVSLTTQYDPWLFRIPALPSFVPFALGLPYTEKMTFWERVHNMWTLIDWAASPRLPYSDDALVLKYASQKPFVTVVGLARRSQLWLFDTDVIIDYPRPMMAAEINIGGLTTKPAKPLPDNLQSFMDSSTNGVIIVSFGSYVALTKAVAKQFLQALVDVKMNIVWKYSHELDVDIPENIKILKWIPQNDLLGHPKTKLFITHCGANGQFEALFHAVPMIGFPVYGDQPYNAKRIEYRGFGLRMDILNFTYNELVENIHTIIQDDTYATNIKKASEIFRSRPQHPREKAAYWIEHVLEFGGDHLRSYALDMPWYDYIMLDLLGMVCAILLVVVWITFKITSLVIRLFWSCTFRNKLKPE